MWIVKLVSITDVSEYDFENAFRIYPNPTTGILNYADSNNSTWDKIEIVDITGAIVVSHLNSTAKQIDVSSLTTGIYFVRFENQDGIFMKNIVIV